VFGTPLNAKLVGVVVLNREALDPALRARGADPADAALVRDLVTRDVQRACREAGLMGYEVPAALHVQDAPFTVDSGVLTPTLKIVRQVAKKHFRDQIVALFLEVGEAVVV